jgi:hypothetical protein
MTAGELEAIRTAIADVQTSTDAIGLDVQRVVEIIAWTDTDSPQPPEWVNGGAEDAAGETDGPPEGTAPSAAYPPPRRANVGAAAGLLVIAACAALLVVLLVLLWLLGT